MAPDPAPLARLARLAAELDVDLAALEARALEVRAVLERGRDGTSASREDVIILAVHVHGWYTCLETMLERVARLLDETVPSGPGWHAELLQQMRVEVPAVRPAVLVPAVVAELHELRKFRHFFRNAYVLDLDGARVSSHAERLARVHPPAAEGLRGLRTHLDAVIAELARP